MCVCVYVYIVHISIQYVFYISGEFTNGSRKKLG